MEEFQKKANPNSNVQGKNTKRNGRENDGPGGYDNRNGRGRPYDNRGRGNDRQGDRRDNDYGRGSRGWKKNDNYQGKSGF